MPGPGRKATTRRYRRAIFDPNLKTHGMNTERYEAIVRLLILGPCSCKRRVVLAGFPVINGQPQIHQHIGVFHNPLCPVHGEEGTNPITWHL